jgi:hypothetical protein
VEVKHLTKEKEAAGRGEGGKRRRRRKKKARFSREAGCTGTSWNYC